jgi:hypothetical protein
VAPDHNKNVEGSRALRHGLLCGHANYSRRQLHKTPSQPRMTYARQPISTWDQGRGSHSGIPSCRELTMTTRALLDALHATGIPVEAQ